MLLLPRISTAFAVFVLSSPYANAQDSPAPAGAGFSLPSGARFRFGSLHFRHPGGIRNSALSPNGKLLATASGRSVMIWDLQTGRCLRRFATPGGGSYSSPRIHFSADGVLVGYVHSATFASVWNVKFGNESLRLDSEVPSPSGEFTLGQFTPDGKEFIISDRKNVRYRDLATGKEARSIPIQRVSLLSPDSKTYIELDEKATTIIGEVQTGREIITLKAGSALNGIENGLAFSPDGKWLALVHIDKAIELRDTATWTLHAEIPLPAKAIRNAKERYPEYRVGLTRDGKMIFLGLGDGSLHRWEAATRKELTPLKTHEGRVANLHDLPDGSTLITTGADGLIRRWDLATGASLAEPEGYAGDTHAAFSADGRLVVVGDARGRIDLWNGTTGKMVGTLQAKGAAVRKLAFDPNGAKFAVAQANGVITLREIASGTTAKTLPLTQKDQQGSYVTRLSYSPDGQFLYACTAAYQLLRFGVTADIVENRGRSGDFALSADGKLLAGAYAGKLTLWDEPTGKIRVTTQFENNRLGYPVPLAISPDGRLVAAGLIDGHIVLFDARNGAERKRVLGVAVVNTRLDFGRRFGHRIHALQFSRDSRLLISAGSDNRLRIWEAATAKQVAGFDGHEGEVCDLTFGPDNRTAFSGGRDGQGFLWDLRPDDFAVKDPEKLWEILASADADRSYRAVWALSERPTAAAKLLRSKIAPVEVPDPKRVRQLIADLNSANFKTRDTAVRELAQLDERARFFLEEALKKAVDLELQRRLEKLLVALQREPTPMDLREIRAVQALELSATPETHAVLRLWASGAAGARLTVDATAALGRSERKAKQ